MLMSIPCRTTEELRQMLEDDQKSLDELARYNGTVPGARAISETRRHRELVQRELDRRSAEAPSQETEVNDNARTVTLPARFVRDWLDSADGEFFNTGHNDTVEVLRETAREITLRAEPDALLDLRQRAEYYVGETYDEPYLRGLQASARAVLRRLNN